MDLPEVVTSSMITTRSPSFDLASQQDSRIAVILYFLTVGAVTDIFAVQLADGHGGGNA